MKYIISHYVAARNNRKRRTHEPILYRSLVSLFGVSPDVTLSFTPSSQQPPERSRTFASAASTIRPSRLLLFSRGGGQASSREGRFTGRQVLETTSPVAGLPFFVSRTLSYLLLSSRELSVFSSVLYDLRRVCQVIIALGL